MEIKPGIGLGTLRFSMSATEVLRIMGEPEKVETFDSDIHMYYWTRGIFLFFSADEEGLLSGIEVNSNCACTLAGQVVFPRNYEQTMQLISIAVQTFCPEPEAPTHYEEDDGTSRIESKVLGIDFYLLPGGNLGSINWI